MGIFHPENGSPAKLEKNQTHHKLRELTKREHLRYDAIGLLADWIETFGLSNIRPNDPIVAG